jgi:hypothetical protein
VVIEPLGLQDSFGAAGGVRGVAGGAGQAGAGFTGIRLAGGDWPQLADYAALYVWRAVPDHLQEGVQPRHEPSPVVQVVVSGAGAGAEQWRSLVAAYFPLEHVETVLRIIGCESSGRADAVSADGQNWGLAQINLVHLSRVGGDRYALLDPETNIRVAAEVWRANSGFSPWACY